MTTPTYTYSIIEDDPYWQNKIAELLTPANTWIRMFSYPSFEAFVQSGEDRLDIHFLLLDSRLPGLSGECCVRLFRKLLPDYTKIVMVSAYDDMATLSAALRQGADGYVVKSDLSTGLGEQLLSIRESGALLSPDAARQVIQKLQVDSTPYMENGLLSPKEWQMLHRLAQGDTYEQAAENLRMPLNTFRYYIKKLFKTLKVDTSTAAVSWYNKRSQGKQE
jgi:DNA-binding NarL/FixJ family response regulator